MTQLHLAPALTLPIEAVTAAIGILGVRGSGKTTTASVVVEEIIGSGCQAVIIDPLDAWFGLRSNATGDGAGLPVVVFGGDRGDLPLEPSMATVIANLIVEEGISAVLSLRHLSKTAQRHLVAEFAEQLYHRKGEAKHRRPLHVVVDEADAFVPQHVRGDVARVMGAIDDLVRRGRSSGFGVTLITQRAAAINKDSLSQVDILIAHRTVGPQDRKALESWIDAHDSGQRKSEFMASIASLNVGEAWVWSPSLLDIFERVQIRQRHTFDSSATPKVGQTRIEPTAVADIDMELLRERLAAVVEDAEGNDPVRLKRQMVGLRTRLEKVTAEREELRKQLAERVVERVDVPVMTGGLSREAFIEIENSLLRIAQSAGCVIQMVAKTVAPDDQFRERTPALAPMPIRQPIGDIPPVYESKVQAVASASHGSSLTVAKTIGLKAGERRILDALAKLYPVKVTKAQLGTLSDLTMSGGSAQSYFRRLLTEQVITLDDDLITITPLGFAALNRMPPVDGTTSEETRRIWLAALPPRPSQMLGELIAVYPDGLSKDALADRMEMTASGGAFGGYLTVLRQNGLIVSEGWQVKASGMLFEGGERGISEQKTTR